MTVKEVTLLRKSGNLREAYKMAIDDLKEDRNDSWAQMSLFWVLRDICEQLFRSNAINEAKNYLKEMSLLLPTMMDDSGAGERAYNNLYKHLQPNADVISKASELSKNNPSDAYSNVKNFIGISVDLDSVLHEDLGWIIYRYIKAKISDLSSLEIRMLLRDYMNLKNERPSMLHSQILNFALSFSKNHPDFSFYRFFMLWDPTNLRNEDLRKGYYNGSEIPSLISRICRQIVNSGEEFDIEKLCKKINLTKIEILDLLREPQFWKIMNLHKEGKMHEMFEAFSTYNRKNTSYGSSPWHSEVLKIAERYMSEQESWRFIYFFRDWGYENLMHTDWKEETDDKGNTYKPLAVKAAKKCYESLKDIQQKDVKLVTWLDSLYDIITERYDNDEWILRQRAIIYIWQQQFDAAIRIYKTLLLDMSDKYYIWSELADCIQDDDELKIGLLSKSLLNEKNEEFLGSIHLSLANLLIKKGLKSEALCELNIYKKYHKSNPVKYQLLLDQIDKTISSLKHDNKLLYHKYASLAEDFVFSDIEAKEVTLVDKWEVDGKIRCNLTNGIDLSFQVNVKRFPFLIKAELGSIFSVKCYEKKEEKQIQSKLNAWINTRMTEVKCIPLCMQKVDKGLWTVLPQKFGFVEYLNEDKKILHIITQDSVLAFQTYKEKWGTISKGDFISFREYTVLKKDEKKAIIANVEKADKECALPNFSSGIIVIDDINKQKNLLHYTFGQGNIGGVISLNSITFCPEIGQCLKISYCITNNKQGEKKAIVLHIKETNEVNQHAKKTIQGHLVLKYRDASRAGFPDFGFIGDYYVHRSLLIKYNITTDCNVTADVIYAGQGKWKVIKIY